VLEETSPRDAGDSPSFTIFATIIEYYWITLAWDGKRGETVVLEVAIWTGTERLLVVARGITYQKASLRVAENSAMGKMIVVGILLGFSFLGVWIVRETPDVVESLGNLAMRYVGVGKYEAADREVQKAPPFGLESNTAVFMALENQGGPTVALTPPREERLSLIHELVNLIQQFFPDGGDFPMRVWPDKGMGAVYVEGEKLSVHVAPETNAHLQVDYFQSDGTVVHLLPNPAHNNFVEGGKTFVIGKVGGGYEFVVTPPFGVELLTVIASQEPLEADPERPIIEPAGDYIERFLTGLTSQQAKGKVAGAHVIIRTKKS
jgi:Domain of unknown function (DUF4384)